MFKIELFQRKKKQFQQLATELEQTQEITQLQNYFPIYQRFFVIKPETYQTIHFNTTWRLEKILHHSPPPEGDFEDPNSSIIHNVYECQLRHNLLTNKVETKKVFFKYVSLVTPLNYILGEVPQIPPLPNPFSLTNSITTENQYSLDSIYHNAYIDTFFIYLSSKLLTNHSFIHGLDFYASFLGIKKNYSVNITEDLDDLLEYPNKLFLTNLNKTYYLPENLSNYFTSLFTPPRLIVGPELDMEVLEISELDDTPNTARSLAPDTEPNTAPDTAPDTSDLVMDTSDLAPDTSDLVMDTSDLAPDTSDLVMDTSDLAMDTSDLAMDTSDLAMDTSDLAPDTPEINVESSEKEESEKEESEESEETKKSEDESEWEDVMCEKEEDLVVKLPNMPIQLICMEYCQYTLDDILYDNCPLPNPQDTQTKKVNIISSALFQTIMCLIVYQKCFLFTHNDLHTNNIMAQTTTLPFIYYKWKEKYYRVPTYGYIYKIIDFGRAIFQFQGQVYAGHHFDKHGDAYGQFNTEPFYNPKKPRIDRNFSFDLCRLGCCLLDFLDDNVRCDRKKDKEWKPMEDLVEKWCTDDLGKNICYKKNGEERYPNFKLYEMIVKKVHNVLPENQLNHPLFQSYSMKNNKLPKDAFLINLDDISRSAVSRSAVSRSAVNHAGEYCPAGNTHKL